MTITDKKSIESLHQIIKNLEKDELKLSIVYLKSAVELLEQKFMNDHYPASNMSNVKYVITILDRNMRLKTKADRKYYGKLIDMAATDLSKIYSSLYEKIHSMG